MLHKSLVITISILIRSRCRGSYILMMSLCLYWNERYAQFSRSSQIFTTLQNCLNWYHRRKPRMIQVSNDLSVFKSMEKIILYLQNVPIEKWKTIIKLCIKNILKID